MVVWLWAGADRRSHPEHYDFLSHVVIVCVRSGQFGRSEGRVDLSIGAEM